MKRYVLVAAIILIPGAVLAQPPAAGGPLVLERIDNGVVLGPAVTATSFDGETGVLLGFSGGWLQENTLFVGGAGYWLVDGARDRELGYGGLLAGWNPIARPAFTLGGRALVGWGTATLGSTALVPMFRDPRGRNGRNDVAVGTTSVRYNVREDFFAFQPEVIFSAAFARRIGLHVAGGYRFTGNVHALRDRVEGVTGTVGLAVRLN